MFNIGDVVEIINDDRYNYTKIGSIGVVVLTNSSSNKVFVHFVSIGEDKRKPQEYDKFYIYCEDLKFLKKYTKEEEVLDKIKDIYSRQYKKTGYGYFL